jgi:hypothetical protein
MTTTEISYRELFFICICGTDGSAPDCRGRQCEELLRTPEGSAACGHPGNPGNVERK